MSAALYHYRSRKSPATLGIFLQNQDVGMDLQVIPRGFRMTGLGEPGGQVAIDVTRDDATGETRCSCSARRRSACPHIRALAAVGLLDVAAVHTGR
jgi:hypothetical protein